MTDSSHRARHRSSGRPLTPLDDLASAASTGIANVGRRSAVVAASGGLVMTMTLPAAAAPSEGPTSLPPVDVAALTAEARAALATSPVVSVPADAAWGFDTPAISVVANPKPPPPPPARSANTTARSTTRVASGYVPQAVAGNAVLVFAAR